MIFYTSDLHFGHANVIKMCHRDYQTVEEMDEDLIKRWNAKIGNGDTVYILGDLIFKAEARPEFYLDRLRGKKHLIIGNHDKTWMNKVELSKYFQSVERLAVINTGKAKATLCHFPMMDHEGRYLIHGHIHANTDQPYWGLIKNSDRLLNAGVDVNAYVPVTFEEMFENNLRFKAEH